MTTDFVILFIMLILNMLVMLVKKENLVIPSMILGLFTISICIYYVIEVSGLTYNAESLFCAFVAVIGTVTLYVKGSEKY